MTAAPSNLSTVVDAARRAFSGASWLGVLRREDALPALDVRTLLHAGPPLDGPPPPPMRNAAALALVFEGLASDLADGLAMLERQAVVLLPAQDHGVVTPLAQVVSRSMPMAVVGDASSRVFAPLIEGAPPALRFGSPDAGSLQRLASVAFLCLGRLHEGLASHPVPLAPVVCDALASGDECHSRTDEAHQRLLSSLSFLSEEERSFLGGVRGFALPVLMAAAGWALRRHATGHAHAIVAAGGNGVHFGIRFAGAGRWHVTAATAPKGVLFDAAREAVVLAAIGDSAVLDVCGLGGQAMLASPSLVSEWQALLPPDAVQRSRGGVDAATGIVDARRVCASRQVPRVNLAMLDAAGVRGLVGRGFYEPPVDLFARALAERAMTTEPPAGACLP